MTKHKVLVAICYILCLAILCAVPCMAVSPEGKLTVFLEDREGDPIDGLRVSVCKVAAINGSEYVPAEGFEDSGISISGVIRDPSSVNAKNILKYIEENQVSSLSAVSAEGAAVFSSLNIGIWIVYCEEGQGHSFNPFFVFLPYAVNDELCYEIVSVPKTEVDTPENKSIYVVKQWEDKNDAAKKRPDCVTVDLLLEGEVIDTVTLNEDNGWAHTFSQLPDEGTYSVEERKVERYSVKYSGDSENGFIITNTYDSEKLPQTGQQWWPIGILSVAGIAFLALGIVEMRGKSDEKKKA